MFNKIYIKHIVSIFFSRFIFITLIFASLIFILNILEEIKFFSKNGETEIFLPIILTFLNLPSTLFELFPFIILISTQFFFIKFQENSEILIFKNNGINNLKIIFNLCILVFLIGIFLISIFHFLSSSMQRNYLEFKNKYTTDNKYLAVINENGLWIKDKLNDQIMIIHSERIDKNILSNVVITTFNQDFQILKNIIAKKAIINDKLWKINDAVEIDNFGKKDNRDKLLFQTNFDYLKINSMFSKLDSLNIYELYKQKKDFLAVGMTVSDIDLYLNKLYAYPLSLVLFLVLTSILMFNVKFKKSKTAVLIFGILLSVIIYYIYYFFGLLATNNYIPALLAIWLPNLIIFLTCLIGLITVNEK